MTGYEGYSGWMDMILSGMAKNDQASWFALVDPCADTRLPAFFWELSENPGVLPLFMNTMIDEVSMHGPLFVPLVPGAPITNWILIESELRPLGCIYSVPQTERDNLFEHLQNLLECTLPSGKPGIFRFFDPRVLYAVANYPDPDWMQYVIGQAEAVYAWEPGCSQAVAYSDKGKVLEEEGMPIDQELLNAISEHTSPYAVISSTKGEQGDTLRAMPLRDAYAYVKGICDSLSSLNIPYLNDFIVGTVIAMKLNNNIFADDYIRKIVEVKAEDQTLVDALKTVPGEYFERMAMPQSGA